jgi:hypothetical protein
MTEMSIAIGAQNLLATHTVALVQLCTYLVFCQRCPKTRPPGTGVVLRVGPKQWVRTCDAGIRAIVLTIDVFTREGRFGALLLCNAILLWRKTRSQILSIGFFLQCILLLLFGDGPPSVEYSYSLLKVG